MENEIITVAVKVFFGVLQGLILVVISGAFKLYVDVRDLKKDLNSAFAKIRDLEKKIQELENLVERNQETLDPSEASCRESQAQ